MIHQAAPLAIAPLAPLGTSRDRQDRLNPAVYGGDVYEPPQYESILGNPGLQPGELKGYIVHGRKDGEIMNRIDQAFKRLREEGKKAFIPYVTAGDPDMAVSKEIIGAIADAGADIIEIGIPFSDPLADGPTIQRAGDRSLSGGCSVKKIMNMVKELRGSICVPFVFMTYFNVILSYGIERFVADSLKYGADGVIVPDLPLEEAGMLIKEGAKQDFSVILLSAPTTPIDRFKKIAARSRGFVYYVSLTGVTGARKTFSDKISDNVKKFKKVTSMPVCVGFGISKPRHAAEMAQFADGVIVGSAIINVIEKNMGSKKKMIKDVGKFTKSIARAVHGVITEN
ncbi:MAG: tryptophan synthase subunit alpha [Candidatus Omnitrophica bacterium]|nr:tryptophan synthase subunit alpha [Candidatus Omnitrophota bacterium]MBU1128640.1 tryptophan synthase subunit alpha [Candidatus Omnitrophota bacterium]MBU1785021.1 tryptophan synthase subunit alpha [Candidatus Omnitrophota bacterium]MBU1852230.1 tryptophan synthase subunit alpha [Candidatus Omnitrophota bacterium]